jgi:transcriptional regulator with XRE-family HTH domain
MDRVRVGNTFRAIRVELCLRQADVARLAGSSQHTVSDIECGRFGGISVDTYCRVASALDADIQLSPRWRGPKLDRLLDRRHALIQNRIVEILVAAGWVVRTEYSFNRYGDRGSVDILAWLPNVRALLIIEIKTEITDLEETLRVLDMKRRVVPPLAGHELGWSGGALASVLVLPDASAHRTLVERHRALVSGSLPHRTVAVRNWIAAPFGDLGGVWFLRDTSQGGAKWRVLASRRVPAPRRGSCSVQGVTTTPLEARKHGAPALIPPSRPPTVPAENADKGPAPFSTAHTGVPEKPRL